MLRILGYIRYTGGMASIFVALALSFGVEAEPAIKADITTFGGRTFWGATRTSLVPVGDTGRFKTEKAEPFYHAGCQDLLQTFQERPLQVMRENGYIDQKVFAQLMNFSALGIEPRQITMISLYSDLSAREVKEYFPDGLPPERELSVPADHDRNLKRVNRGAVYIVRGYALESDAQGKTRVLPKPVPWELDPTLPNGLNSKIDRRQMPFVVEIGRAHAEGKPLPGNFEVAVQLATGVLANDFRTMNVDPRRGLITAHFLDAQHTRLFTRLFPLRILNAEVQGKIQEAKAVADDYLDQAGPRTREEWSAHGNTVVYGSLAQFYAKYPLEKSSEVVSRLLKRAPQPLTGLEAHAIADEVSVGFRDTVDYEVEGFGRASAPLFIRDFGTALMENRMGLSFVRRGFEYFSPLMQDSFHEMHDGGLNELDAFGDDWLEKVIHFPVAPGRENAVPGTYVSNFDPVMAGKMGVLYPASVLLSVADSIQHRLEALTPEYLRHLTNKTNEDRVINKLAPVSSVDFERFIETYPICFGSENAKLQALFREAGAKPVGAMKMAAQIPSGPSADFHFGAQFEPAQFFCFSPAKIRELRQLYHAFNVNARGRLIPGTYNLRMKLLNSSSF